jgi:hypothetical protein
MVSYCANSDCGKPLHYFRDGKVFVFEVQPRGAGEKMSGHLEHFWLCGECSRSKTPVHEAAGIVKAVAKLPDI